MKSNVANNRKRKEKKTVDQNIVSNELVENTDQVERKSV